MIRAIIAICCILLIAKPISNSPGMPNPPKYLTAGHFPFIVGCHDISQGYRLFNTVTKQARGHDYWTAEQYDGWYHGAYLALIECVKRQGFLVPPAPTEIDE